MEFIPVEMARKDMLRALHGLARRCRLLGIIMTMKDLRVVADPQMCEYSYRSYMCLASAVVAAETSKTGHLSRCCRTEQREQPWLCEWLNALTAHRSWSLSVR